MAAGHATAYGVKPSEALCQRPPVYNNQHHSTSVLRGGGKEHVCGCDGARQVAGEHAEVVVVGWRLVCLHYERHQVCVGHSDRRLAGQGDQVAAQPLAEVDGCELGSSACRHSRGSGPCCGLAFRVVYFLGLCHVYTSRDHCFKKNTLKYWQRSKNRKYRSAYHRARFAFAPLVSNSFGQMEGDFLRFLFKCAHNAAWTSVGLGNIEPDDREPISQHDMEELMEAYKALRGRRFQRYRSRMLLTIAEAVTERLYGRSSARSVDAEYRVLTDHSRMETLSRAGMDVPWPLYPDH